MLFARPERVPALRIKPAKVVSYAIMLGRWPFFSGEFDTSLE
jgi:hypothetical protein